MRTLCIALLSVIVFALAAPASAEVKGWGLGAGVFDGDFAAQGRKDIWLGGDISEITGQAGVYFAGKTTVAIDADYHFNLKTSPDSRFYPLAGLHFAFNSNDAKFGVNGGGGLEFMLTDKLAAFGEIKYTFFGWDGWAITGGIYF